MAFNVNQIKAVLQPILLISKPFVEKIIEEKIIPAAKTWIYTSLQKKKDRAINKLSILLVKYQNATDDTKKKSYKVGLDLGAERLTKYAKIFGFGEPTGIELPGEEAGILYEANEMVDSDIATMAIGQSIAVTPLQLITQSDLTANIHAAYSSLQPLK